MRIAFRKVLRDLLRNKGRSVLVVISIAVGVFALGMVTSANTQVLEAMHDSHLESNPSHAWLYLRTSIDDAMIKSLSRIDGVADIEGYTSGGIRWKPSLDSEWQDGSIVLLQDYENQKFDQVSLLTGDWPEGKSMAVEQAHIESMQAPVTGESFYIEINDRAREFKVSGQVRDPFQFPIPFGSEETFYTTRAVVQEVMGYTGFSIIRLTVIDYSEENVNSISDEINDKLNKVGNSVVYTQINHPDKHFLQDMINGVGMVLSVMAVASLGLSTILIINTINALIAQQVPQIGLMKAIGGLRKQIILLYLSSVIIYGLLSLVISVPLAIIGGDFFTKWMLHLLNVPAPEYRILPITLLLQFLSGLLTPVLAALYPILQAGGIAVVEALNSQGLGGGHYGASWLDKALSKIRNFPRMVSLSLRNTFRRPGRVVLTQLTLILAGAIFMMVVSTQHSFNQTITDIFDGFGSDLNISFSQYYRKDEVLPLINDFPGIERAEMWSFEVGDVYLSGAEGFGNKRQVYIHAVPEDSMLFAPKITSGRMFLPEDGKVLLLNQNIATKLGVGVGDKITLSIPDSGESNWTIIGLVFDLSGSDQNTAYVQWTDFNLAIHKVGRGSTVEIKTDNYSLNNQLKLLKDLKSYLETKGYVVPYTEVFMEVKQQANAQFSILTQVLMVMTILMGAVGGIGMSGTLSINVIERKREIGVMRAVGASSRDVGYIFTIEGLILGLLSWILALPVALIAGPAFVKALGNVIEFPAEYYLSLNGIWIWLIIVLVLSIIASWAPAKRATRMSVNESLAYE
ncbi:MAG: ABC transporter permease [Anaerolineales bacterium]|nr:ABC transporter permease [Anaerolineales bacterium]